MPTTSRPLTKRSVDALEPAAAPYLTWEGGDGAVKGFGVMVRPTGKRSFVFQYDDAAGRTRRLTLGEYGALTVDQARAQARQLYAVARTARRDVGTPDPATAARRAREGATARAAAPTVEALATAYLADRRAKGKRPHTLAQYEGIVRTHLAPLAGRRVVDVTRRDVAALHDALADTPSMANRVFTVLRAMFRYAEREDWATPPKPPYVGVEKYPSGAGART
jgi:hypothetical protein